MCHCGHTFLYSGRRTCDQKVYISSPAPSSSSPSATTLRQTTSFQVSPLIKPTNTNQAEPVKSSRSHQRETFEADTRYQFRIPLALQLATFHTGVTDSIVAGLAGILIALENVPVGAGGVDGLVSTELALAVDADALTWGACFLLNGVLADAGWRGKLTYVEAGCQCNWGDGEEGEECSELKG